MTNVKAIVKPAIAGVITVVIGLAVSIAMMYITDPSFQISQFSGWGGMIAALFVTGFLCHMSLAPVFSFVGNKLMN
jgi:hypothetical protein